MGNLEINHIKLRVVLNFTLINEDSLQVTLDSPDQGAKDIQAELVYFEPDSVVVDVPGIMGRYSGRLNENEGTIAGKWVQGVTSLPLKLNKLEGRFTQNRPQEPRPPYPYIEENIAFTNSLANIQLSGTITRPDKEGRFPAVVLVSGSGPQDRNEELMGHKTFLVIADYLTRHDIVVLRYDDRGTGKSGGAFSTATTFDLALDAESAIHYLKNHSSADTTRTGIIGHSEGGLIASIIAAKNKEDVDFAVLLAAPGVPGDELILHQGKLIQEASGMSHEDILRENHLREKLFQIVKNNPDGQVAKDSAEAVFYDHFKDTVIDANMKTMINMQISNMFSPWFRKFLVIDPYLFLSDISCPVLVLNGEKDLQVAPGQNIPEIKKALKEAPAEDYEIRVLKDLNHLFQHAETGLPNEYADIEETISEDVLELMVEWINSER